MTAPIVFQQSRRPWPNLDDPNTQIHADGDRNTVSGFYATGQLWERVSDPHTEQSTP
jgi:hypothetical protein